MVGNTSDRFKSCRAIEMPPTNTANLLRRELPGDRQRQQHSREANRLQPATPLTQRSLRLASTATRGSAINRRSSIAPDHWNASFLNRTAANLTDYQSYNFSLANTTKDLGIQQSGAGIRLYANYGLGSPDGVARNRFAMQAWTRVQLQSGKFYQIESRSDDGTRFWMKDPKTGSILTTLDGWHRPAKNAAWQQVLNVPQGGQYDFYVQYYENTGRAIVDVTLKQINPTGRVVPTSGINLRSAPSSLDNTPIELLKSGEPLTILQKVRSPNDTSHPDWYEVIALDGQRGYVAADPNLVATIGSVVAPASADVPATAPGTISSKGQLTSDNVAFRTDKAISGTEVGRLGSSTPITVLEQVTGGYYLNKFDQWYKVKATVNGGEKEGYIAAYYISLFSDSNRFQTAISMNNPYYMPHLSEATQPKYYTSSYKPFIEKSTAKYTWLKPSIVAGIGSRESAWGLALSPRGPGGTGDGGHGRGLMQIDDRFHADFTNSSLWKNPEANIRYAIDNVLSRSYDDLDRNTSLEGVELLRGTIAAYNAGLGSVKSALKQGLDVDYYTTGRDYSWDVLNRAGWFQLHGWR